MSRRLGHVAAVLVVVSFAVAFMLDLAPGSPAVAIYGDQVTPEKIAEVDRALHLDDPFYSRYWRWVTGAVRGDLGTSFTTKADVFDTVTSHLVVTAELVVLGLLTAVLVAVPIGVYTAYRANQAFDRIWQVISSALISIPQFVSSLILVLFLSLKLRDHLPIEFPVAGWVSIRDDAVGHFHHLLLPAFTLALAEIPRFSRLLRAELIATLEEDYILSARARGLSTGRVLFRHALRPSSFSLVAMAGLSLGSLLSGAVIVETLFAIPGIGFLAATSVQESDAIMVQGIVIVSAAAYVLVNCGVDVLYRFLDPRVRSRADER